MKPRIASRRLALTAGYTLIFITGFYLFSYPLIVIAILLIALWLMPNFEPGEMKAANRYKEIEENENVKN